MEFPSYQGDLVKQGRLHTGWSQRTLATRLGITPGYVALLEQGNRTPSGDLWDRIVRLFQNEPSTAVLFGALTTDVRYVPTLPYRQRPEISIDAPSDPTWFNHVRFTMVTGAPGTGKTAFLVRWLSQIEATASRKIVWVPLTERLQDAADVDHYLGTGLLPTAHSKERAVASEEDLESIVSARADYLEGLRGPLLLCFDDWKSDGGDAHQYVIQLTAALRTVPVVVAARNVSASIPGAVVVPTPQPSYNAWQNWCANFQVPSSLRESFLKRIDWNPLAATCVRGAVYCSLSSDPSRDVSSLWRSAIENVEPQEDRIWRSVVSVLKTNLSPEALDVLYTVAQARQPVPIAALGNFVKSGTVSRLVEYKLIRIMEQGNHSFADVHDAIAGVLPEPRTLTLTTASEDRADPSVVVMLLNSRRFEDAAAVLEELAKSYLGRGEAPARLIGLLEALPEAVRYRHPFLEFVLSRARALRSHEADIVRADEILQKLLARQDIDANLRGEVLLHAADTALRRREYSLASRRVAEAERHSQLFAGTVNPASIATLRIRLAWEQSEFDIAIRAALLHRASRGVDGARLASWEARTFASLGNIPDAVKSAQRGLDIALNDVLPRSEAYNAALLAEYALLQGGFVKAQKNLDRALEVAERDQLWDVHVTGLRLLAELAITRSQTADARVFIEKAKESALRRPDDLWGPAYLLVSQGQVARSHPDRSWLTSTRDELIAQLDDLERKSPSHPIVERLRTEAIACAVALGERDRAKVIHGGFRPKFTDWLTRWNEQRLTLILSDMSGDDLVESCEKLLAEAQTAGCSYLAAATALEMAHEALRRNNATVASHFAAWCHYVAQTRGWKSLVLTSGVLLPAEELISATPGRVLVHADGTRSVVAPRRYQRRAKKDQGEQLPDPFDDDR